MEVPDDAPYSGRSWPQVEKNYAAMVTRLDADVGKLLKRLKRAPGFGRKHPCHFQQRQRASARRGERTRNTSPARPAAGQDYTT